MDQEFEDLFNSTKETLPNLQVKHGGKINAAFKKSWNLFKKKKKNIVDNPYWHVERQMYFWTCIQLRLNWFESSLTLLHMENWIKS